MTEGYDTNLEKLPITSSKDYRPYLELPSHYQCRLFHRQGELLQYVVKALEKRFLEPKP